MAISILHQLQSSTSDRMGWFRVFRNYLVMFLILVLFHYKLKNLMVFLAVMQPCSFESVGANTSALSIDWVLRVCYRSQDALALACISDHA